MTFLTVKDFLKSTIPAVVAGKSNLTAIFATYNEVPRYRDGPVDTKKTGLIVTVQNGNRPILGSARNLGFMMSGNHEALEYGIKSEEEASREAQLVTKTKIAEVLPAIEDKKNLLVVVYAGLYAFNESIASVRELRKELMRATIVVLTCDCELRQKEFVLDPLVRTGEVHHGVVTPWCGGRDAMREILDGLITAWSAPDNETVQTA